MEDGVKALLTKVHHYQEKMEGVSITSWQGHHIFMNTLNTISHSHRHLSHTDTVELR